MRIIVVPVNDEVEGAHERGEVSPLGQYAESKAAQKWPEVERLNLRRGSTSISGSPVSISTLLLRVVQLECHGKLIVQIETGIRFHGGDPLQPRVKEAHDFEAAE